MLPTSWPCMYAVKPCAPGAALQWREGRLVVCTLATPPYFAAGGIVVACPTTHEVIGCEEGVRVGWKEAAAKGALDVGGCMVHVPTQWLISARGALDHLPFPTFRGAAFTSTDVLKSRKRSVSDESTEGGCDSDCDMTDDAELEQARPTAKRVCVLSSHPAPFMADMMP